MLLVLIRTVSMRWFFWAPKHMFKLMDKKIIAILRKLFFLYWPYDKNQFVLFQGILVTVSKFSFGEENRRIYGRKFSFTTTLIIPIQMH